MILLSTEKKSDFDIKNKKKKIPAGWIFIQILMPHRVWLSSYRVCDVDEP